MILSGMSTVEQIEDNTKTFSTSSPLNNEERELLLSIARKMTNEVPCTACRYCTDGCPKNISIPEMIKIYNTYSFNGRGKSAIEAVSKFNEGSRPSDCISCKCCESVCPQNINISEVMAKLSEIKE
jgi:predicted aldo/keto reductase-like oxidoreductase